jgi:feruloyl-CoA synthase
LTSWPLPLTSQRVARALVLRNLPTFDAGEVTEKGSLNARLIRQRRRGLIERLHQDADDEIIRPA